MGCQEYIHIDFYGEHLPAREKCEKVLELMKDAKDNERTARFICAICFIDENGKKHIFEGICEGKISTEVRGNTDFCYDYIFLYKDKTFAEISIEEKNKVSHRKEALNKFIKYLKEG